VWLLLTPEEWVRRHVVEWLTGTKGVVETDVVQEFPVLVEGMPQRADIVVHDGGGERVLLVECKAPGVKIDAAVLDQAVRYNAVVRARHLMLTNGLSHYFYTTYDGTTYVPLDSVPEIGGSR
jgi:hypothetical protein